MRKIKRLKEVQAFPEDAYINLSLSEPKSVVVAENDDLYSALPSFMAKFRTPD